jgi:hypothetical protein
MNLTYRRGIARAALGAAFTASAWAQGAQITEVHTLPEIPIGSFVNSYLPGAVLDDHGFKLGGIGSGIWKGPGDQKGIFWMITDRGPNPQTPAPISRSFPVPGFSPFILKVKAENGVIDILEAFPITDNTGGGVTGLPNDPAAATPASPAGIRDERPFNCDVTAAIPGNPHGLDTEDIVQDVHGNFWTVEEYGPSIAKISSTGRVLKRFVPVGRLSVSGTDFPVAEALPQILGRRPRNRGFEGLAMTPNNQMLMAVVQSPLVNQTAAIGNASRVVRLIEFSTETETTIGEYAYVMQPVTEFAPSPVNPTEMKISAIAALDQHRYLVLERTDKVAKIFKVDIRQATNILGGVWDSPSTTPSLESLAQFAAPKTSTDTLSANGVVALEKELVLDLSTLGPLPDKIEGLTVIDGNTLAVSNDNDFQVGAPTCGTNDSTGVSSNIFIIKLDKPIK